MCSRCLDPSLYHEEAMKQVLAEFSTSITVSRSTEHNASFIVAEAPGAPSGALDAFLNAVLAASIEIRLGA